MVSAARKWGRRLAVLLGLGLLVALLAHGALIDLFGGHSARRALQAEAQLSPAARALVERCLQGLDRSRLVDHHAHLAGLGNGSDCWVNPRLRTWYRARDYLRFRVYRSAAAMSSEDPDSVFVEDLAALAGREPRPPRPLLLAFDHRHDDAGERNLLRSEFFVPNDHALAARDAHPGRFHAAASIHPYRPDALAELERVHAAGVRVLKWLPAAQGIDLTSPRCDAFYAACARLGVALLVHVGEEQAVHAEEDQALGNPLHLRRPLAAGVRVLAAHCASLGTDEDLDDPARPRVPSFELFLRLMGEEAWEGLLFGEISTVTQRNRYGGVLATLLERTDLHPRLVNGSDWPLPAVNVLYSTRALQADGFLEEEEREALGELYHWSPLLFDLCLKRTVRVPGSGAGFADEVFYSKFDVGGS